VIARVTSLILHNIDEGIIRWDMSKYALKNCTLVRVEKAKQCTCEGLCIMGDHQIREIYIVLLLHKSSS
jgi:hypothetical protein